MPLQQVITPPGITPLPSPGLYGPYIGVGNPIFHAAPFGAYPVVPVPKVNDQMQVRPMPKRAHDGESRFKHPIYFNGLLTGASQPIRSHESYGPRE